MNGNRKTLSVAGGSGVGKNPYELRTDLLKQAYQILDNQYKSYVSARTLTDREDKKAQLDSLKKANDSGSIQITPPSVEEVIAAAKKLNDFISQKDDSNNY